MQLIAFTLHSHMLLRLPCSISMVLQVPPAYLAERHGNLQQLIDVFAAQRLYADAYYADVPAFSAADNFESLQWAIHAGLAAEETAHVYPFRANLIRL